MFKKKKELSSVVNRNKKDGNETKEENNFRRTETNGTK